MAPLAFKEIEPPSRFIIRTPLVLAVILFTLTDILPLSKLYTSMPRPALLEIAPDAEMVMSVDPRKRGKSPSLVPDPPTAFIPPPVPVTAFAVIVIAVPLRLVFLAYIPNVPEPELLTVPVACTLIVPVFEFKRYMPCPPLPDTVVPLATLTLRFPLPVLVA